jgi:RWP-RK domain
MEQASSELLERIIKEFDKPIHLAAKKLKYSVSLLRKICREIGIVRWPFRTSHRVLNRRNRIDFQLEEPRIASQTPVVVVDHNKRGTCANGVRNSHIIGNSHEVHMIVKPNRMRKLLPETQVRILPSFQELLVQVGLHKY